jgi:hypothetical protein
LGRSVEAPIPKACIGNLTKVGVTVAWVPRLAAAEFAGATGPLIGLTVAPAVGIAAGVGPVPYFVGAVLSHDRAGD